MPIEVSCECGKRLRAPDSSAGRRAKCPGCGRVLQVPAAPGAPAVGVKAAAPQQAPLPPVPAAGASAARPPAPRKPAPPPRARPAPAPTPVPVPAAEDDSDEYGLADE